MGHRDRKGWSGKRAVGVTAGRFGKKQNFHPFSFFPHFFCSAIWLNVSPFCLDSPYQNRKMMVRGSLGGGLQMQPDKQSLMLNEPQTLSIILAQGASMHICPFSDFICGLKTCQTLVQLFWWCSSWYSESFSFLSYLLPTGVYII